MSINLNSRPVDAFEFIPQALYIERQATLHRYSEYFEDKPLERLIAPGIVGEHNNDDALGRCLDALYEKGVSSLTLGEAVVKHLDLSCDSVHRYGSPLLHRS